MKNRLCLYVIFGLLSFSCDSQVEGEIVLIEELISVSSVISPQDSIFHAYVFHAGALGTVTNSHTSTVKDAQVIISDGFVGDTLIYNDERKRYEAKRKNLIIESMKSYFLTIKTASGKILSAECSIPPTPEVPEIKGKREKEDYVFTINWNNLTGFKYFTLALIAEGKFTYSYPEGIRMVLLSARLLEDIYFPSKNQLDVNIYDGIVPAAYLAKKPKLRVILRYIEEDLYHYLVSYKKYEEWQSDNEGNLIPNFREPLPIHSNIDGGVGIFAGYNQSIAEIDI